MDKYISICFDDGWKSQMDNAFPLLHKYGFCATFYIVSDYAAGKASYMSVEDLKMLEIHGHEIGSHTKSHKHLPEISTDEAWQEITQGLYELERYGFKPRTFAYPFGEYNSAVIKYVRETGFLAARGITRSYNNKSTEHMLLNGYSLRAEHSASDVISWINNFLTDQENEWLIIFTHQVEPAEVLKEKGMIYGTTPELLDKVFRFLRDNQLKVVPVEDGFRLLLE
jgi:peptidoglycan/xylan/chitin deacetylase (PgdA/CDA1 family)